MSLPRGRRLPPAIVKARSFGECSARRPNSKTPLSSGPTALLQHRGSKSSARAVALSLDWTSLPDAVEAWDSLDVLVIGGDAYSIPAEKNETLRRWTERGGRVLFLLGSRTPAYQKSPVAEWSPIAVEGTVQVTSLENIKSPVSGSSPLRMVIRKSAIPAAHLPGSPEGTLPGPAVLGKPYGFGFITAFAFDFEQEPLSKWESQTDLLRQLTMPLASRDRPGPIVILICRRRAILTSPPRWPRDWIALTE